MIGPVMLDMAALMPDSEEWERILHPLVGGVILFSRNYASPQQLIALTSALHARKPELLIAVDHEGGRVQRFQEGFTRLPAMAELGRCYDRQPESALHWAHAVGQVLAWELVQKGVDFSFTPVLDLDHGQSAVIGNRAFHRDPAVVARLATALCEGLRTWGMIAVGKHFPGHGGVQADSHLDLPVDERSWEALQPDLGPFEQLIAGGLEAIMPAHILYPRMDSQPAGYSSFWLKQVLRSTLRFDGVIFSDDLSMNGALGKGSPGQRAQAALAAGCDMVLLCNDAPAADQLLQELEQSPIDHSAAQQRLQRLRPRSPGHSASGPLAAYECLQAHASDL